MDQGGEDGAVHVAGLASDDCVVEVTPPPLGGEGEEVERSIVERAEECGVRGERGSLLAGPGDGRRRLSRHSAVQHSARLVGEGEGGGQRQVEGRSIALGMKDRT